MATEHKLIKADSKNTFGWCLFYFRGLEFSDSDLELDNPLFDDCTFIPKNKYDSYIDEESLEKHKILSSDILFDSFIGVKYNTIESKKLDEEIILSNCRKRAKIVSSLLSIYCMNQIFTSSGSFIYQPWGLSEDIFPPRFKYKIMIDSNDLRPMYGIERINGHNMIMDLLPYCTINRLTLKNHLGRKKYRALSDILGFNNSNADNTFKETITVSALNFYNTVHNPHVDQQLLGMLTSIEVLLRLPNDKYEDFRSRLNKLIGDPNYKALDVEKILKARHDFVHRAKPITDNLLVMKAIILATLSILKYADSTKIYNTRCHLIKELDSGVFSFA